MVYTHFQFPKTDEKVIVAESIEVGNAYLDVLIRENRPANIDMRFTVKMQREIKLMGLRNKIKAVKMVRAIADCGLKEAHDTVIYFMEIEIGYWQQENR